VAAPDPRFVYRRTPAGRAELEHPSIELAAQSRRLLALIDGTRTLAQLPLNVRPAELPMRLEELLMHGLIALSGISELPGETGGSHDGRDPRLDDFKRRIAGAVERELGPAGSVLEARLQDCVNLTVMRTVMREVIERVRERGGEEPAARLAQIARTAARAWLERDTQGNV
jgi:hypothetical protein